MFTLQSYAWCSYVPRNLISNIATKEDLGKVMNINNEGASDIEDDDYEPTYDLELQGVDNLNETEMKKDAERWKDANEKTKVETKVKKDEIDTEAISKILNTTNSTISRSLKLKMLREFARKQANKLKATSSK